MTEKRVKLSTIVKSQVPDYVRSDFPLITEFLKEYYKGQEYQGGPIDLINNIDRYLKIDSFANRVYSNNISKSINTTDSTIEVIDTSGFPDSYGLIKIDNEIITYKGKTDRAFTGCIRGFSGICELSKTNSPDEVLFESTNAETHINGAQVLNLSVLFLAEFLNKTKKEIATGFDDREFYSEVNQNTFLKQVRSFYASKGTEDSFKILFKALYGTNVELVNPADLLFRPSDAQFNRVESLVVDPILNEGEFDDIQNITLFQDYPVKSYAPISYSEKVLGKDSKVYHRLDIDAGYNKDITFDGAIYGDFKVTPKTKLVNPVSIGASYLDVESTVGFANTGHIAFKYTDGSSGTLYYGSKTINQFRDAGYIYKEINEEENITDRDTFAYATINGKKVQCNVSSIISEVNIPSKSLYNIKGITSRVKTLGFEGSGFKFNDWVYNNKKLFVIGSLSIIDAADKVYRADLNNNHYMFKDDTIEVIDNSGQSIDGVVLSIINEKSLNIRTNGTLSLTGIYTLKKDILKGISAAFPQIEDYQSNIQNIYANDENNLLIASSSIPSEPISLSDVDLKIDGTFEGTEVTFDVEHKLKTGDKIYYYPEVTEEKIIDENFNYVTREVEGSKLFNEGIYYAEKVDNFSIKFALSKENIFFSKYVTFAQTIVKNNKIRLYDFHEKTLLDQKLLREIPVPLESSSEKIKTLPGTTGILLNGVEILNYKSRNNIYYGEIKSIDVNSSDNQFDIINPPNLVIADDGRGRDASGFLGITGSLSKVKIVNRGFDYEGTPTIKIVGGNGSGASVLVNMKSTDNIANFNSKFIRLDPINTIGVSTYHKFRDHEEVVYQTNDQLGITGLTTNTTYFVGLIGRTTTYSVTVSSKTSSHPYYNQGSGNGYYLLGDNYNTLTQSPNLQFVRGETYVFNQNDTSSSAHALYFSTVEGSYAGNDIHEAGVTYTLDGVDLSYSQYANGFAAASNRRVSITVDDTAPATLYYACQQHQYMGNAIAISSIESKKDLNNLKLYNTRNDAVSGINTVSLTVYGNGVHSLTALTKKRQIDSISIVEPGEGYSNKKVTCQHTGINTATNSINSINHGYISGDRIQYMGVASETDTQLVGLSLNADYIATVLDKNNFTLSEIGIGNTINIFADRKEYVNITTTGIGTHIFNHPPIQVILTGQTAIGTEFTAELKPKFLGSVNNIHISNGGVGYGVTNIQDFERSPFITYSIGQDTQIKASINNGSITEAIVLNRGNNFTSSPDVVVDGDGTGAVLTAVIRSDGRIEKIIVVEGGRGYNSINTNIRVVSSESLSQSKFKANLQSWKINLFEDSLDKLERDDGTLTLSNFGNFGIQYAHLFAPRYLRSRLIPSDSEGDKKYGASDLPFNRVEIDSADHSPIIGWAYDGNPIYGPYGYSEKSGGVAVRMKSGYYNEASSRLNRPPNYSPGYFVEDYTYYRVADDTVLDENNGRYCVTPEFPNGTYAYFTTISEISDDSGPFRDYRKPVFPYLIGDNYFSVPSKFNTEKNSNQDGFDLNTSDYKRNTTVYNFFDRDVRYPYINLPNDLNQTVTIKNISRGKVDNIKVLNGGNFYKVGDRLVFDQKESGGNGLAAKVSFIEGKEITKIENDHSETLIEILPSGKKDVFVGVASTAHGYFNGELISLDNFSTTRSKLEGNYSVVVPATTLTLIGLGTTTHALGPESTTGIVTFVYVSNTNFDLIRENDVIQINQERVKVLNVDSLSGRLRIIRKFDSTLDEIHYIGVAATIDQRRFEFTSDFDTSFNFRTNREYYFDPEKSIGITEYGNPGTGKTVVFDSPGAGAGGTSIHIEEKLIYLRDHDLKTGDIVVYNGNNSGGDTIKYEDSTTAVGVGSDLINGRQYYVAKFSKDFIGISTVKVGIGSTGVFSGIAATTKDIGLVEFTGTGVGEYHSFTTQYPKITADAIKNRVIVSTATTHGLSSDHRVIFDIKPQVQKTVVVKYDDFNRNILIDPKSFEPTGINTSTGIITIENHGFSTGDKLIHTTEWVASAFPNNTPYFAVKINNDKFKLSETLYNSKLDQPITVVGVATTAGTLSPVNPIIDTEGYNEILFDLSDPSLQYEYFSNQYPAFELDFYVGKTFNKPWTKNPEDIRFKVVKSGIVGSNAIVKLSLDPNTPKDLYYNLVPKYTQGVPLSDTKKDVYLDNTVNGAGYIKVSPSLYSGSHKIKVSTAATFTYNLASEPKIASYEPTNASLSYITDCTHTDGPISRLEVLNIGDNYNTLPGFTTVTSINGVDCDLELQSSDIGLIKNIEITKYGYDFPYDQTIRPLFYYPQSLKITPFSSIDFIGISSFGRGYFGTQELVVIDGVSKEIVSDIDLQYTSTSAEVTILRNTYGMNNVIPKIYPINSGAGVPVDNSILGDGVTTGITYNPATKIAKAIIKTEYSTGDYYPFEVGEKIMIEGSNPGSGNSRGFNSSEFNYNLYTITSIDPNVGGGVGSVEFSMADQLKDTETVIEYDLINSATRLLPQRDFPTFDVKIKKNEFIVEEIIKTNGKTAIVEEWDKEFSILKVNSVDEFEGDETIIGQTSKSIGTVGSVLFPFKEYGKYGSTIKQNRGWKAIAGFLNNDLQRIPDNDYYQNFSYSLKSTVPLQTWNDPISSMNHVAGYKKFANYQLESYEKGLRVSTSPTQGSTYVTLIKDIVETININCVNDFDLVRENSISLGDDDLVSTQIIFESRLISDFDQAIGNRVLEIDDISHLFSHRPRPEEFVNVDRFSLDRTRFLRFITLVRDQRFTSERQVSIFDVLHDGTYGYSNEYSALSTVKDMGSFDFAIDKGEGLIQYHPISEKVAFNDLNISYVSYKIDDNFVGVGSTAFGDIALINTSSAELNTVGAGVTIVSIGSTYNSVSVMVMINPDTGEENREFQFTQVNFIHDGTNIISSGEYASLFTQLGAVSEGSEAFIGYGTFYPYLDGNNFNVEYIPNAGIGTTAAINTIQIGLAQTATSGSTDFNMVHTRMQTQSTTIAASASPGITTVNDYRYIANSQEFHAAKYYIHVADKTNDRHEFVELFALDTINAVGVSSEVYLTEFANLGTSSVGLGTFGAEIDDSGFAVDLQFTPIPNIDVEVNVFAQQLKSETADDVDTILDFNNGIVTTDRDDYVGTFNAIRTDFDLTHEGEDIFEYWFDGGNSGIVSTTDNTIKLPNHFFISGEKVSYFRNDINDESSAIGVGETFITGSNRSTGVAIGLTEVLPDGRTTTGENLYMVKIDDTFVGLATSPIDAQLANPNLINITSVGSGTSHRFLTTKQNSRVLVTIDNIIQSPIVSTAITSSLNATALSTTDILEFTGVTSFFGGDFLRINSEIMKVTGVGANGDPNKVRVRRAKLGTKFVNHAAGDVITKISGNYNIIDSTISFAEAPYGLDPLPDPLDPNSLDWEGVAKGSSFHGRSYMRGKVSTGTSETYDRNNVFKDVADKFNGLESIFPLQTTDGDDIADIANENAIVLINSVFQLPGVTVEEDYRMLEETAGITSAIFNGDARDVGYDVGISSFPAAGIIQGIGSTEGFGYQPLVSAAGTVTVNGSGQVTFVSVGFTGSGYRSQEYHEIITKTNYPISTGTTNIFIENENSVFGILSEIQGDGTNTLVGIGTYKFKHITPLNGIGNTFIQLRPFDQTIENIPSGTPVSIGVTLPYGIVNVSAATSNISPGVVSGLTYDVLNADYNPESGFMAMTLPIGHELSQGDYIRFVDNSLNFTCSSDNNTRVKSYPRPNLDTNASRRPLRLEDVSGQSARVFVGLSTFVYFDVSDAVYTASTGDLLLTIGSHNFDIGRGISIETDSLSFKCAMDGNTATKTYPRSTDPAANTTLDITGVGATTINVNVGASPLVNHQVSAATYTPTTGVLELTIGSHTLTSGTSVRLGDNSLTFTCAQDSHGSNHTYPRSGDPAYQTAVNITGVGATTITLNVGTSSNTTAHTFVSAVANAVVSGGNYLHSFQSATANAIRAGGQYTHTFVSADTGAVVSTATTSIQHIGFATVIIGTGHISPNVTITNPGYDLDIGQELMPQIIFDEPKAYGNLPLIFSDENVEVGLGTEARVDLVVSNDSSVSSFNFTNNGYAYGNGNILTVSTGGLAGIPTSTTFSEFQITIEKTFDDTFNGWNLGELEVLDNVDAYIDGRRKLFPLFRNGSRLSIIAAKNSKIDTNQLLLVFLNNILQVPKKSYFFFGGNRIRFTEAPRVGDSLRIVFYKGNGDTDVVNTDVIETVKEGDTLNINSSDIILNEDKRTITDLVSTDTVETLPYFGPGNTADSDLIRPVDWCRQSEDKILNGLAISKAREFYEPNILPNAYLIKSVGIGETVFHVNTTRPLFVQNNEFNTIQGLLAQNSIKIHSQIDIAPATATATVSTAGTVSSVVIADGGHGYLTVPTVSIASTNGVGIGTSGTAIAIATLTNGVVTEVTITNGGVGYSTITPPKVLISPAQASKIERCEVYFPSGFKGDSGTVVGFATTAISGELFALFDLFIPSQDQVFDDINYVGSAITTSQITQGDVFTIYNSNIGISNTSITSYDGAGEILGISTSYIDGVYEVIEVVEEPRIVGGIGTATARVRAKVDNTPVGFDFDTNWDGSTGMTTSNYQGSYSWGKIVVKSRVVATAYNPYNSQGISGITTSPLVVRDLPLRFVGYQTPAYSP